MNSNNIAIMLYDWPTWTITVGLFCGMLAANEIGFRLGRRHHREETEPSRTVSGALKASVLGLVALLLAFSFSATTNRYNMRQRIVLDQANAVGTCYQRAGLLPEPSRDRIRETLRQYVRTRLDDSRAGYDRAEMTRMREEIDRLLNTLWSAVEEANRSQPDAVRNSMIVPAANEVIDLSSSRAWASRNHLPDPVLVLLLASVLVSGLLLGHSSGQSGKRHVGLWSASNLILALVLFVVLDFDRPRRGLIRVDQTPLVELDASFKRTAPL
ncbi:MAG: hypothetical protein ABI353_12390 [Isosphaeraceae bacterium]